MSRRHRRIAPWAAGILASCAFALTGHALADTIGNPSAFLARTESLRTEDHPRFVRMLDQIHREAPRLTTSEQWQLRYLDAWQTMFEGNHAKAESELKDIIAHGGDETLAAKASALLLSNLAANRRYAEAFALANRVTADLPRVKDPGARFALLTNLSQMLNFAGQTDLAIQYAQMAEHDIPPGETLCRPLYMQAAALYNGKRLALGDPILQRALDACESARQPVFGNALWLILGTLYLDANRPTDVLALLDRIGPSIHANQYHLQMLSAQLQRAQAYEKLGRDDEARKAALAAVAMSDPGDVNEWLRDVYEVLYRVEKKRGNTTAALAYYERYAAQDKGYLDDISARAVAYETARQHTLLQNLETEKLSQQNSILRLQQALDVKTIETGRLYIALLLLALAWFAIWLLRLRRSQQRFKKLSSQDGLTGILNHQHFIAEAGQALRSLERRSGTACLIFIDLDHFKRINDTHGHARGDAVLRHTVALCQQALPAGALFGRLGGEEFGVLLIDCPREQGKVVAERIRRTIKASPQHEDDLTIALSVSVGLTCTDTSGHALQSLCRAADAALYQAKRDGRDRIAVDGESNRHGHLRVVVPPVDFDRSI